MRADRLIRALFVLQSRERVTAGELATELEVSVATARRDLEALAVAGVPVYPQQGRGGGWRLVGGARTNLTGLTAPETRALFTLLGGTRGVPSEAADAIRKLLQAVPATFREAAERAAGSTLVDDAPWGTADQSESPQVRLLQGAIAERRLVHVTRADGGTRTVLPLGIALRAGVAQLLAHVDGRVRLLRVDRLRELEVGGPATDWPRDFDLRAEWAAAVRRIEALRGAVAAEVVVAPHAAQALLGMFGEQAGEPRETADGRFAIEVRAHRVDALAEQLAGWHTAIEVVGPPEVRDALAELGAALVDRYGSGGS